MRSKIVICGNSSTMQSWLCKLYVKACSLRTICTISLIKMHILTTY